MEIQAGQDKDHGNDCRQGADRSHRALQPIGQDTPLLRLWARCWYPWGTCRQSERARKLRLRHGVEQGHGAAQFPENTLAELAALEMSIKKSLLPGSKLLI